MSSLVSIDCLDTDCISDACIDQHNTTTRKGTLTTEDVKDRLLDKELVTKR